MPCAATAPRRLAAVVTTAVTVVLLGVLIPIFQTAQAKSDQVRGELNFQAALFPDATGPEIKPPRDKLAAVPHVESVQLLTKAEALKELNETFGKEKGEELLSQLNSNPLPTSFRITPDDAANLAAVETAVFPNGANGKSAYSILSNPFGRQQETQKIEQVTSALKIVLSVITALLLAASLMLIGNTIRLSIFTRRREVEVMRLVGATRWFIRWPFIIEGVVVGFVGGLVAILVLWLGKITIVDPLSDSFSFLAAQNRARSPFRR